MAVYECLIGESLGQINNILLVLIDDVLYGRGINVIPQSISTQENYVVGFRLEFVFDRQEGAIAFYSDLIGEVELFLLLLNFIEKPVGVASVNAVNRVSEMDTVESSSLGIEGQDTDSTASQLGV